MTTSPKHLGKYELREVLGRGGMAEVWKGFDPQLKRYVAVKFMHANLRSDPDFKNRFLREGQAIAAHRSQFPIQPNLLPLAILQALMGQEYFVPVSLVSEVEPEFLTLQEAS